MQTTRRAIAKAGRRWLLNRCLATWGWSALAAFAVSVGLLLMDRLLAVRSPQWLYAVPAGAALLAGPIVAWLTRPGPARLASILDERLGLKDRLGTAWYLASGPDRPFRDQVLSEADRAAVGLPIGEAMPLRGGRGWAWATPAWAVFALLAVFLPAMDLAGLQEQRERRQQAQAEVAEAQESLVEARSLVREASLGQDPLEEADPTELLDRLAELTQRDLTNPELRREAVAQLAQVQDKLDSAVQQKEQQLRTMQNQMSALDPGTNGPADRLADALRRGDFAQAQKELEALAEQVDRGDLTEGEKKLLQQQLEQMARQIQEMAEQARRAREQLQKQIAQQLQQQGLSQQQVQQLQQQGYNQQAVQQALQQQYQQQGMSQQQAQQQAQQMAQKIAQQQQQQQAAGQNQSNQQGLSQSMMKMSQALGQQSQAGQGGQSGAGQGGSSQFGPASWQGSQQLAKMAQMQNQLQRMRMAQSQCRGAMQGMGQNNNQTPGRGGQKAGSAVGGDPYGVPKQTGPYNAEAVGDIKDGQGRIIASWLEQGPNAAGEATVEFNQAVTSARQNAERAVTEDRVPRRYHGPIREYFSQLPDSPEAARQAPAAPR